MRWSCAASISAARSRVGPRSTKPSSSSSMSVPIARSPRTSCFSRSDSFTRSSLAPRTRVSPDAWLATTARRGISSSSEGTSAGRISVPRSAWPPRTRSVATGSPARDASGSSSTRAPIRSSTARKPVRVGFTSTPRTTTLAPGTSRPAPTQNAADEGSPGTSSDPGRTSGARSRRRHHLPALDPDRRAPGGEHPLGVVAGRLGLAHPRLPVRREAGQHQRALHLGAGDRADGAPFPGAWPPARPGGAPARRPGPPCPSIRAPIARSGPSTRRIGRLRSEASPSSVHPTRAPATSPSRSRMLVPLLPQSSTAAGARKPPGPTPRTVAVPGASSSPIETPSARRHAAVERTSAPGARLRTCIGPVPRAPKRSARWEIDLSPGASTSASRRPARRTRTRTVRPRGRRRTVRWPRPPRARRS